MGPPPCVCVFVCLRTTLGGVIKGWSPWLCAAFAFEPGLSHLSTCLSRDCLPWPLARQLPEDPSHPFFGRVKVLVMNAAHGLPHQRFDEAVAAWGKGSGSVHDGAHVEFFEEPALTVDPGGAAEGTANRPGAKVRRQTRNIASVLRRASLRGRYFLFLEDDMVLCPQVSSGVWKR